MPTKIELNIENSKSILLLQELIAASRDLSPVMREVAGILADSSEQALSSEVDPSTGQSWQSLTESHKSRRSQQGYTGSILSMTGQLASSIQSGYGSDFAQVGSNLVYAAIHQHGGTSDMRPANAAIPARPFLGVSELDQEEIIEVLKSHLETLLF